MCQDCDSKNTAKWCEDSTASILLPLMLSLVLLSLCLIILYSNHHFSVKTPDWKEHLAGNWAFWITEYKFRTRNRTSKFGGSSPLPQGTESHHKARARPTKQFIPSFPWKTTKVIMCWNKIYLSHVMFLYTPFKHHSNNYICYFTDYIGKSLWVHIHRVDLSAVEEPPHWLYSPTNNACMFPVPHIINSTSCPDFFI